MRKVVKTPFPSDPRIDDATILGKAVRACRTEAGLTIEEAAMTIGVAKQTLSDLEAGKPTVKLGSALKIAHDLGVNLFVVHNRDQERLRRAMLESDQ
jgi:DNA-binding XRE family transcriptional regulator